MCTTQGTANIMCGIIALTSKHEPIKTWRFMDAMRALQHRGYNSFGFATSDGLVHKESGQITDRQWDDGDSTMFIGHLRYTTSGSNNTSNIQPFVSHHHQSYFVHNGQLYPYPATTSSDSWIIFEFLVKSDSIVGGLKSFAQQYTGAYSCIMVHRGKLIAFRDPRGIRPLVQGTSGDDGEISFASETVALDAIGHKFISDVRPGEVVIIDLTTHTQDRHFFAEHRRLTPCVFEYIYFADKRSTLNGISVRDARIAFGESLARQPCCQKFANNHNVVVIPLPKTSCTSAKAFARALNIPYLPLIRRRPDKGRSFILDSNEERYRALCEKFQFQTYDLSNHTILLVDDSIVRGTTMKYMVNIIRERYHPTDIVPVSIAPRILYGNHYGIDIREKDLIARERRPVEAILGCKQVIFQSMEGIKKSLKSVEPLHSDGYEMSVFDGIY